ADSRASLIGNYHGTSSRYITVLEGLQDALGEDVRVMYAQGAHLYKDRTEGLGKADDRLSEAVTVAEESDAVVLVVGLDETLEGEQGDTGNASASGDKFNLLLPESQRRLLDTVLKVGKPTVIVLLAGSAIDLGDAADRANAVLLGWYPGARGGRAVAELLLGKVSPSGKLPVTFYHNSQLDEMPAFTDYAMQGRTYRYFPGEPVYPFGYGLTYGDVAVTAAQAVREGDVIRVRATARNASGVPTDEVVQVYCQNEGSDNAPRNPRLVGFQRIHCPANASVDVEIAVPAAALRVVDENGNRVEEGQCVFFVGVGQPDSRTQALTGHASVRVTL
ncbi:MAG: glycoside hydrolase family 3 C-terminal domain-containing protein, partial [Aristaeellaceae bacterium]